MVDDEPLGLAVGVRHGVAQGADVGDGHGVPSHVDDSAEGIGHARTCKGFDGGDVAALVAAQHDGDDGVYDLAVKLFVEPTQEHRLAAALADFGEVFHGHVLDLVDELAVDVLLLHVDLLRDLFRVAGLGPAVGGHAAVGHVLGGVEELGDGGLVQGGEEAVALSPVVGDGEVHHVVELKAGDAVLDHDGLDGGLHAFLAAGGVEDGDGHLVLDGGGELFAHGEGVLQGFEFGGDGIGHGGRHFALLVAVVGFEDFADAADKLFLVDFDFGVAQFVEHVNQGAAQLGGILGQFVGDGLASLGNLGL